MTSAPLTTVEFRQALGRFATGITVVTAERAPGLVHGMTANSFTAVSLHPLMVLICVDHNARLLPMLQKEKRFGIGVLRENQQAISEYFAQPEENTESEARLGIRFSWTSEGIPILDGTLVQLGCSVNESHVCGDHTIFIAEVLTATAHEGAPLLFYQGNYRHLASQP